MKIYSWDEAEKLIERLQNARAGIGTDPKRIAQSILAEITHHAIVTKRAREFWALEDRFNFGKIAGDEYYSALFHFLSKFDKPIDQ
jgi:hypothetical protein